MNFSTHQNPNNEPIRTNTTLETVVEETSEEVADADVIDSSRVEDHTYIEAPKENRTVSKPKKIMCKPRGKISKNSRSIVHDKNTYNCVNKQ